MAKLVIATAVGFHGQLRINGEKFEIPDDERLGSWMQEIKSPGRAAAQPPQEPALLAPTGFATPVPAAVHDFRVQHIGAGNWAVIDKEGAKVGEAFKKDPIDKDKAKVQAQAEADRLNREGPDPEPAQPPQEPDAPAVDEEGMPDA